MARKSEKVKSMPKEVVKTWTLCRLYATKEGLNCYQLMSSLPTAQEWCRFRIMLEELQMAGIVEKIHIDHARRGQVIYRITNNGRVVVGKLRSLSEDPSLHGFIPAIPEESYLYDLQ